jgi:hypothetical protein
MKITMCEKEYYFKLKNNNVVYYTFQQRIPNWKSLFKNSILSGSSLGAHWELSRSLLQLCHQRGGGGQQRSGDVPPLHHS